MNQSYNNEYEIISNDGMGYQPKYPLMNAPGSELQQMDYKDWMNRCVDPKSEEIFGNASDAVRDAVIIGVKIAGALIGAALPPVKVVGQILGTLIPFLWPKQAGSPGTTEAQFTWEQMMTAAEEMIDQKIDALIKDLAIESLKTLQSRILDYQQALCNLQTDPDNERYKEDVRREFNDAEDQAKAVIIRLENPKNAIPLLTDYVQAANLHLLLLQDVIQFGESWGFTALEVQQYYSNNQVGNPGMKQLLATYTDHCVRYYNEGLKKLTDEVNGKLIFEYRKNMTLIVLDIVSVWPTYDPIVYNLPTRSQLTRQLTTLPLGNVGNNHFWDENYVPAPNLFRWLREIKLYRDPSAYYYQFPGYQLVYQNTLAPSTTNTKTYGGGGSTVESVKLDGHPNDDVYKMRTTNMAFNPSNVGQYLQIFDFYFAPSGTVQTVGTINTGDPSVVTTQGIACNNTNNQCSPCTPCEGIVNISDPCDSPSLYSHRLSWISGDVPRIDFPLFSIAYNWTHVSADKDNLIDAEKITQIPAVKGYDMGPNATVIKGPGSTGGDLVQLVSRTGSLEKLRIRVKGQVNKGYQLRIRYALASDRRETIYINRYVNNAGNWQRDYGGNANSTPTYLGGSLNYNSFGYTTQEIPFPPTSYEEWDIELGYPSIGNPIIIDKIEFIPIEGSVEEFEANQAVEKARKEGNALFTNEA
ncbi:insecticidal delta-endotoxin Cry8Ea1 family protein, partial [Bacillus cereus]|uniref:insecticidal delta-endotoxin Cry8Ea1 family protein n=2 Tax=Bacillus cereus TaxID=1396 RepID=UPI000BFB115A